MDTERFGASLMLAARGAAVPYGWPWPIGRIVHRWPATGRLFATVSALLAGIYHWVLRSCFKWFIHVFTNRCEIERVMLRRDWPAVGWRNAALERSLLLSKCPELREIPTAAVDELDDSMGMIVRLKSIAAKDLVVIQRPLRVALTQMCGYNALVNEVERVRMDKYDSFNEQHERKLMALWKLMMGDEELPHRITKRWQAIGFQGDDPATDFRGMGVLGLDQLVYLFSKHHEQARRIALLCAHPTSGLPLAIAGISMTALLRDLLRADLLRAHFYNTVDGPPALTTHYHDAYCQLFSLFCVVWKNSQPESVMEFERVRRRLHDDLTLYLDRPSATLPLARL